MAPAVGVVVVAVVAVGSIVEMVPQGDAMNDLDALSLLLGEMNGTVGGGGGGFNKLLLDAVLSSMVEDGRR